MCHWTEYDQSTLQVRTSEENILNATTQQFITAKISGCALKQGSKTHSSLRQSNLQLQNEAPLMFLSHTSSGAQKVCGWTVWRTPRFARSNLAKLYTRIENAHKVRKKNFIFFVIYRSPENFLFSFFPVETLSNVSISATAVFELVQQLKHATEIGNVANAVSTCAAQPWQTKQR